MKTLEIPAAEAKQHLSDYLAQSAHGDCRVVITRRGRRLAAIVSLDDLRELEQIESRSGLASIAGKWDRFDEITDDITNAREYDGGGRDVSL